MSDAPFSYEEAVTWIASHSLNNPAKFQRQALGLGPRVIPAMIEVLANAPMEQHTAAALILSFNGVKVRADGDSPEAFQYVVTMPHGEQRTVRSVNTEPVDFIDEAPCRRSPELALFAHRNSR